MKNPKNDLLITIVVAGAVLGAAIYMFLWVYNSPAFSENLCRIEMGAEGFPCRTVLDQMSYAHTEVFVDNNWVDICNSKMEHYCEAT